ncbi:hypothetical protein AJ87_18180 [Rhizobium yanglingense]|nr:hypothetical protein AJ87_18180 [Rhizobium yanglingense]
MQLWSGETLGDEPAISATGHHVVSYPPPMLPALVPSAFATAAEASSDAAAASAHPEGRRASFGFENEAVALVKGDALTEDRALLFRA